MKQWLNPEIKELDFLCTNYLGRHHGGHGGHGGHHQWPGYNPPTPPTNPTNPPQLS